LKKEYEKMSFFIIQTHGEQMIKLEVFADRVEDHVVALPAQMSLFDEQ